MRSAKQKDVGSSLTLDQNFLCMLFLLCETFFANSFNVPEGSPFIFLFCKRMDVKKISKCPPFTVFGIVRFFKSNNFCLKIRFSQAQHAISDFCFFLKTAVFFLCDFFSNLFSSKPPQFLLETKRFASIKHCSRFSALCDLPETFIIKFSKILFLNFLIFKGLRLRKMGFLLFPVGEELFSRFMVILSGFFGVKLMKF